LRRRVLQKLAFALNRGIALKKKETPSKRGRPPGAKNKPKEPASADPFAAKKAFGGTPMPVEGNDVDNDASAEERKAIFEEAPGPEASPEPTPPIPGDQLDIRNNPGLDRRNEASSS
jgi:hypothetical protein